MFQFFKKFSKTLYQVVVSDRYAVIQICLVNNIFVFDKKEKKFLHFKSNTDVDVLTANEVFFRSEYSFKSMKLNDNIMRRYQLFVNQGKPPLIIDCGANIGLSSVYFCHAFPFSKIIALEPDRKNFEICLKNSEQYENIFVKRAGINYAVGKGKIKNPTAINNEYIIEIGEEGDVELTNIEVLAKEHLNHPLFIVKVDIEGSESELFSGNTAWIDRCDIIMIELHDWLFPRQGKSKSFLQEISKRDRDFVIRGENVFSIRRW